MNIDFAGIAAERHLDTSDVNLLNSFFNSADIIGHLVDIEDKRKKLVKQMYVVISLMVVATVALTYFFNEPNIIIFGTVVVSGYIGFVKKKFNKWLSIKNTIMPLFVKIIDPAIEYAGDKTLFPETVDQLSAKLWLLKHYDRVDLQEDSVKYMLGYSSENKENHSIELCGCEIETSEKHKDSKGNTNYVTTNHCYILKLTFLEPRFLLKSVVRIKSDSCDIPVIWFFGKLFAGKKRVTMENVDFEKSFDVLSDDPVESRMFVTPSFMTKLLDFSKKTNKKYEFYFKGNEVYIKGNLSRDYMEFSLNKNVFANTADYVQFYVEIKNIKDVVKDLWLFYYDKGTFSQVDLGSIK